VQRVGRQLGGAQAGPEVGEVSGALVLNRVGPAVGLSRVSPRLRRAPHEQQVGGKAQGEVVGHLAALLVEVQQGRNGAQLHLGRGLGTDGQPPVLQVGVAETVEHL